MSPVSSSFFSSSLPFRVLIASQASEYSSDTHFILFLFFPLSTDQRVTLQKLIFSFIIFSEPNKLCDFKKTKGKILKTVDSVYEDVKTENECKEKCINAPYRCFSFDLGDPSNPVCRTSHLDRASLSHIEDPYTEVADAITWELYACYNGEYTC